MPDTVLIVDADPGFTESAQTALEAQGMMVHVRDDASLDLIRKLRPTVMMLNVELPKGASTGFSICSRIRRDRELKATPILLTSADATVEALKKHAQSSDRADDYARKPVTVEDVVMRLLRLIDAARPEDGPPVEHGERTIPGPLDGAEDALDLRGALEADGAIDAFGDIADPLAPDDEETGGEGTTSEDGVPANGAGTRAARSERKVASAPATKALSPTAPALTTIPPPLTPVVPTGLPAGIAPPPLKRDAGTATDDLLWRPLRLDEALKGAVETPEPQAPAKATPEERLAFLRQLVKHYEARDKAFREAWQAVQQQGQDLARRVAAFSGELQGKDRRIDEILLDRDHVYRRLQAVETEFKTFQDEITRIFRDKDAEEQQTFTGMRALEASNAALNAKLKESEDKNNDHERRLEIFRDEIDGLTAEKDAAETRIGQLRAELEDTRSTGEGLRARLEMTDTVASERADEIERLREQLDRLAMDIDQERKRLERANSEAIAALGAEHKKTVNQLEEEHQRTSAELKRRQTELLETLSTTHEHEVEALETERATTNARIEDLKGELAELETRMRDESAAHAAENAALRADVEVLEHQKAEIADDLERAALEIQRSFEEREELRRVNDVAAIELADAQQKAEGLETALADERAQHKAIHADLEETLEKERKTGAERIAALEEELENAQNESFERLAELEKLKKAHEKLQQKTQNLDGSLKTSERALSVSDGKVKALEANLVAATSERAELTNQNVELERKVSGLSDIRREIEGAKAGLEEALSSTRNERANLEVELASTRDELTKREDELSRREAEIAQAYANATDAERRLRDVTEGYEQQIRTIRYELEATKGELLRAREENEVARSEIDAGRREVEAARAEIGAGRAAVDSTRAQLESARAELERASSEIDAVRTDLAREQRKVGEAERRAGGLERDLRALEEKETQLLRDVDVRDERIVSITAEIDTMRLRIVGLERDLATEQARASGLSAETESIKARQAQAIDRVTRALGTALEALGRSLIDEDPAFARILGETVPSRRDGAAESHRPAKAEPKTPRPDGPPRLDPKRRPRPTAAAPAKIPPAKETHAAGALEPKPTMDARGGTGRGRELARSFEDEATSADGPSLSFDDGPTNDHVQAFDRGRDRRPVVATLSDDESAALENLAELLSNPPVLPTRSKRKKAESGDEEDEQRVTEIVAIDELK